MTAVPLPDPTGDPAGPAPGEPAGLQIRSLDVDLGGQRILDGIDLDAGPGSVVAVLGRSGSGKSTLLRAVAGLVPLASGRVLLDGLDLSAVPVHQRALGFMFQDHALFGHLDVAGNVAFGLRMRGVAGPERRRRVDELLEVVGLAGYAGRTVASLSGGEAQRVALARALAPHPRLLLLDEPLASLDRPRRTEVLDHLSSVMESFDPPALYVTHDRDEAFAIADRLVVIDGGRVVRHGDPAAVWADPRRVVVAELLGHPNVVAGGALAALGLAVDPAGTVVVPTTAVSLVPVSTPGALAARLVRRRVAGDLDRVTVALDTGVELVVHAPRPPIDHDLGVLVDLSAVRPVAP